MTWFAWALVLVFLVLVLVLVLALALALALVLALALALALVLAAAAAAAAVLADCLLGHALAPVPRRAGCPPAAAARDACARLHADNECSQTPAASNHTAMTDTPQAHT